MLTASYILQWFAFIFHFSIWKYQQSLFMSSGVHEIQNFQLLSDSISAIIIIKKQKLVCNIDIQLPTSAGSSKKQESPRKASISALLTMPKPLTVWITINCGKFWKRWAYQTTWPASWETCMQVRKQQLELDVEQQTGSKWEKEYVKALYCHPAYWTYMQSTSWEMLGWRKHKLEQDSWEKYQ